MDETKNSIAEILQVPGDETTIYLETDGNAGKCLFAVIEISDGGASIVDNCYRTIGEAQRAWPEAIAPKWYHLTRSRIEQNCSIPGQMMDRNSRHKRTRA
jgi:hypothetical protein